MNQKQRLSVVIIAKNESEKIKKAIRSVSFADEILVIDDFSDDDTGKIAEKLGAQVHKRFLNDNFAEQRNYGLDLATSQWVLFLDADEYVSKELAEEIQSLVSSSIADAYSLQRQDLFLGKRLEYGETGNIRLVRLAKKNAGRWKRSVHEYWDINGKVDKMKYPLIHSPHKSISSFIDTVNYYSSVEADLRLSQGVTVALWRVIVWPIGKFFQNYILKLGFLDGFPGLVMAYVMSLHSLMVRIKVYAKKVD